MHIENSPRPVTTGVLRVSDFENDDSPLRAAIEKRPRLLRRLAWDEDLPVDLLERIISWDSPELDSRIVKAGANLTEAQLQVLVSRAIKKEDKSVLYGIAHRANISENLIRVAWDAMKNFTTPTYAEAFFRNENFPIDCLIIAMNAETLEDAVHKPFRLRARIWYEAIPPVQKKAKLVALIAEDFPEAENLPDEWVEELATLLVLNERKQCLETEKLRFR